MQNFKYKTKLSRVFKKSKLFLRSIAFILIFALIFTSLPMDGIIALAEQAIEESKLITVVEELEQYRTEFSKTYLKSDGTLEAVVSANPIHYEQDGEWVEIDSTLEITENDDGKEVYQNKKGKFKVNLPTQLESGSEVEIENGDNKISIKLLENKKSKGKKNNDKKQKAEKLTKDQRKRMTAGELFEADNNQLSALEYTEAYSNANLRYDVTPNEVKESIILQKAPNKKATYSYEIIADGLTAVLNGDNSIDFFEGAKTEGAEPVFSMPAPHMFDSNDEYSYDIVTTLENKDGKYLLTYKPSYEWLKAKERAYPVTLDPTVTVNSGIQDSYTFSGEGYKDSYTGYEQQLKVGTTAWIAPNDYWQTYLKFTDLPQIPYEDYRIDSAYLMLTPKATTGNWQEMELGVYELTEDWKNHQTGKVAERITFNNAPADVGYSTATASVARGSADNGVGVGFEIAHIVEKWYDSPETNFGIKLAAHLEASQYNDNLVFHSSRSTTGTAPYLSLTYTEFVPVERIEITGKQERIEYLRSVNAFEVSATVYPENATNKEVIWESTNESAAYYDDGIIWAAGVGTTTIIAKSADNNEIIDSFDLEVYNIPIETIAITNLPENNTLETGMSHQLAIEAGPDNASDKYFVETESSGINWYSSDNNIVSVDYYSGLITAYSHGTAVITATYGDVVGTVTLTVPEVKTTAVDFSNISSTTISLFVGDTLNFTGIVDPSNATDKRTVCRSLNSDIVSIYEVFNPDSPIFAIDYQINALSVGTAVIRLEAYNDPTVYKEITVNVELPDYEYSINAPFLDFLVSGNTHQLITNANEYIVDIEDLTVISADDNGVITALESGTTKIYIGTNICEGVELYEYTITVIDPVEWKLDQDEMIYCGETYTITNNNDVHLYAYGTGDVQINNNNSITATDLGEVTIEASYNGIVLETIRLYILEGLKIAYKPQDDTIYAGQVYESLSTIALPSNLPCEAEWWSSDETIAEIYYDYAKGRVVLTGKSEGSVWIGAESPDPVNSAQDGFWLYVDLISVESFTIVNHPDYSALADHEAYIGDAGVLKAQITPDHEYVYYNEIEWASNSGDGEGIEFLPRVEKNEKLLRIKKAGTYEISATIDGLPSTNKYTITVKKPKATITDKPQNNAIYKGGTHTLDCEKEPTEATVEWVSKNESIATVDKATGKITAKSSGYVVIAVKIIYKNRTYTTDSFTLNVRNQWIWVDGYDSTTLIVGDVVNLRADVGANAGNDRTVAWKSSKESIASVDSNGKVTANAPGTVTITAYLVNHPDVSWPVVFEVKSPITITNVIDEKLKLDVGKSFQLKYAIISSKISVNTITWDVVDDDIAKISSNGNIMALKAGNTKVKVYINGNSSLCDEIELSVCLTQKSYIYYINTNSAELRKEIAERDRLNLANKFYGGDTSKVVLKLIEGKTDFKNYWNNMDNNSGYIIINCTGEPELLNGFSSNDNLEKSISVQEIKGLNKKNMEGLILLSCNGGHLDYVTDKGNVAMAFSRIINGAPVIASDGSVIVNKLDSHEYENLYASAQDGPFCYHLKVSAYTPERVNKSGWYMYYYANHSAQHTAVANSVYNKKDYDEQKTKVTLTFSKILETIHNFEVN